MTNINMENSTRVVVTGIGTCSSLGHNVKETEESLNLSRVNFKDVPSAQ